MVYQKGSYANKQQGRRGSQMPRAQREESAMSITMDDEPEQAAGVRVRLLSLSL